MPHCNWRKEISTLGRTLEALSFRDKDGAGMTAEDGFRRWRDFTLTVRDKRRVCFFIGNGASASMASHLSADLAKNAHVHTQVFSDLSLITAVSNDIGFDQVFAEPIRRMGKPGDMLMAISSSGNSPNIIHAVDLARTLGLTVITLTAMEPDNPVRERGDLNAWVPALAYGHAESCHAAILHYWMDLVSHAIDPPEEMEQPAFPALFDRSRLKLRPLVEREDDFTIAEIVPLEQTADITKEIIAVAQNIVKSKAKKAPVIMMIGAHVIRSGVQRYIIDLMEKGYISALCLNGGGIIHDYELALTGSTTESVAKYVRSGQFGLWQETGRINTIVADAAGAGLGVGEGLGKAIATGDYPHNDISLLAVGHRLKIPVTAHIGIGYDIVHEHANCDGAAWGAASYTDFLRLTGIVEHLEGGVVMNFGSAVMAPEIFLKALAMARNVARSEGKTIERFTTLVTDLRPPPAITDAEAAQHTPEYYFRPFKTMLVRTVSGKGGMSYYVQGTHAKTVPQLWSAITRLSQ